MTELECPCCQISMEDWDPSQFIMHVHKCCAGKYGEIPENENPNNVFYWPEDEEVDDGKSPV